MFKSDKAILILSDESVCLYASQKGAYDLVTELSWANADVVQDLAKAIKSLGSSVPVVILYDMVEQYYRREAIPKVAMFDQADLIKRRLATAFPNYTMRGFWRLQKQKIGTKKENTRGSDAMPYIFAALPDHQNISKISDAILESGAIAKSICLLPVESVSMVQKLSKTLRPQREEKDSWTIFISQHRGGGLRQIVLRNGELALTRLTPVVDTDVEPGIWCAEVAQEFNATMSYLSRFGFNDASELEVIAVGSAHAVKMLADQIQANHFFALSTHDAARLLRLRARVGDDLRYGDILHAAWAAQKYTYVLPFKFGAMASVSMIRSVFNYVIYLLAFTFLGTAGYMGYATYTTYDILTQLSVEENTLLKIEQDYAAEVKRKEEYNIDYKLVQGSLAIVKALQSNQVDVVDILRRLATTLTDDISIGKLDLGYEVGQQSNPDPLSVEVLESKKFYVRLAVNLPTGLKPEIGNKLVSDLRDRMAEKFPDYDVSIQKAVEDLTYNTKFEYKLDKDKEAAAGSDKAKEMTAELYMKQKVGIKNDGPT